MGTIKDRNSLDVTEVEDTKKWQKYTEELYKKDSNDPDNHDGVITPREPDMMDCEVKQALGSITMNKESGGDGVPVELFQMLLHSICQQIWEIQQQPQDWKSQFSFQSQRKAMPNSIQTTAQLHSSHMLAK